MSVQLIFDILGSAVMCNIHDQLIIVKKDVVARLPRDEGALLPRSAIRSCICIACVV